MSHHNTLKRRDFLRIIGAGSVAGIAALALGRDDRSAAAPEVVTETRLLMGTVVNMTLITPDRRAGQAAITACMNQMAGLEAVMSRYQSGSQLSRLNREGTLHAASPHLMRVLREAQRIAALTNGAFDVTVKPLVDLYQHSLDDGHGLPEADRVAAALARVGYRHLELGEDSVTLARAGMAVTLDGIAKGYIVDQGIGILHEAGFENVLVEAGGDLSASGSKAGRAPWRIGIQPPRDHAAPVMQTFTVTNQAAATSGDYMQSYTDTLAAHHILDPRTGYSAPELASATVIAANGMEADALATALMVMGPERGLALVETLSACEAYLIAKDARIWRSSGFVAT